MEFDENGWAVGAVEALGVDEAWSLLSPEPAARVDAERWVGVAQAFFRARI